MHFRNVSFTAQKHAFLSFKPYFSFQHMKQHVYILLAAAGLLLSTAGNARATHHPSPLTETPTATERKAAAAERKAAAARVASRKTFVFSAARKSSLKVRRTMFHGLEPNKSFTTPRQLQQQLHLRQNRLKMQARREARARRARCIRQLN
ncbi:MAG TPA: hypothetical protein VF630_11675 [Hymenobacter sp.]